HAILGSLQEVDASAGDSVRRWARHCSAEVNGRRLQPDQDRALRPPETFVGGTVKINPPAAL
ncbi:MAG TPA: hypothetical protein P5525_24795, partial [Candidatus Paceibacterota bacterium]|nr:hypothetical protein [Candidatus Paceibacterota bacterium]